MTTITSEKYLSIVDAAVKVIAENGYHKAQISRIAREAGVADGTIYIYFRNKEDLIVTLFRVKLGELVESIREDMSIADEPFEKLARLISAYFTHLQANRQVANVLYFGARLSEKPIRGGINKAVRSLHALIEDCLSSGVKMGGFRSDLNISAARQVVYGSMDEAAASWISAECQYPLAGMAAPVFDLLTRCLSVDGQSKPFPANLKAGNCTGGGK